MRIKFLAFLLIIHASSALFAQTEIPKTGTLFGNVEILGTQEPLIRANVVLIGTTIGTITGVDGKFIIEKIPVGTYSVRASLLGFSPSVITDIVISNVKPTEISFELNESNIQVEGVSVTAEFFQKSPDLPLSTQTSSSEEIRRLPGGFEDVVRAISTLPGVAQAQSGRNDLIVRGGSPGENLYIVDNIEVPNINHFGTQGFSGGPLSYINLDFVENTTFSSGGFGPRYGDRLSSVLTINLKDGRKDRLGGKATISATQFGLNFEGPFSQDGSFIFSARRSYLDFIFKAAGFSFVPEYWDFFTKSSYHLSMKDQIHFIGFVILDNTRAYNTTSDKIYDNSKILQSKQNQFLGGLSWRHLYNSGYLTLSAGHLSTDYKYRQNDTLLYPIFLNNSNESESTLKFDAVLQLTKSTEISAGIQSKFIRFNSDIILPIFTTSFGQQLSISNSFKTTGTKTAVYGQLIQNFSNVKFTFGLRSDYFDMINKKFVLAPRISSAYQILEGTTINASIGRYYQSPSYIWLVSNTINKNLKFISVNHYILGIDQIIRKDTKVSLETYIKKYSGYPVSLTRPYLILANTGAGFGGASESFSSFGVDPLVSNGEGTSYGTELFIQKKLSEIPCYGTVSVSYNVSNFKALDKIERPSSFDQRWIINLGGGYIFNEKWEFSTKFRLATGRPFTPFDEQGNQSEDLYNSERLLINHSLDFRVDRRWLFRNLTLITYIDIQNIYNRQPYDVPRYDKKLQRIEENKSIGILPSIGISLEF
jgi:hypothetical protein